MSDLEYSSPDISIFSKLLRRKPYHVSNRIVVESIKDQAEIGRTILKEDWDNLATKSAQMRERALATFCRIEGEIDSYARMMNVMNISFNNIDTKINQVIEYWDQNEEKEEKLSESNVSQETFDFFKTHNFADKLDGFRKYYDKTISEKLSATVEIGQRGYLGGFYAAFNKYFSLFRDYFKSSKTPLSKNELNEMRRLINDQEKIIQIKLTSIYSDYLMGNQTSLRDTCLKTLCWQERGLDWIARISAVLSAHMHVSLEDKIGNPISIGSFALDISEKVRLWIFLMTVALFSTKIAILPEDHASVEEMFKDMHKLSYRTLVKDGKNVSVRDLNDRGDTYDGKYVDIKGIVRNSQIKRTRDGKLISIFSLSDSTKNNSIQVVAVFEHLMNKGIIDGSYVRVNGEWKLESPFADQPILQLKRLQLSKQAKSSWIDKMIRVIQPWFEFYPNSHFITWSIQPGQKGAAELFYSDPFILKESGGK